MVREERVVRREEVMEMAVEIEEEVMKEGSREQGGGGGGGGGRWRRRRCWRSRWRRTW